MATSWPKHPNGVPRLDDRHFLLPPPDGGIRSLGKLDPPVTISRDGRIVNGHEHYRSYRRRGVKDFALRVLPTLPDNELWAIALDLNQQRPEHAARPVWSYDAGNGYRVEAYPPLTGDGRSGELRTALQQAAYLSTRRQPKHSVLFIESRWLGDLQRANELHAPLGENVKQQRRLNEQAGLRAIEQRGRLLPAEGNYQIIHSDYRRFNWPMLNIIVADPPWDKIEDYREVGQFAKRRLLPGGLLLAIAGSKILTRVGEALESSGLENVDTLAIVYSRPLMSSSDHHRRIQSNWRPVLLFSQGDRRPDPLKRVWSNVITVYGKTEAHKLYHPWQQPYWPLYYWLQELSLPGDAIGDLFCGGGTIPLAAKSIGGLACISTDIDERAVSRARARLTEECPHEGVGFLETYRCERKPKGRG
jgi:DNA modification methylase